MIRVTVWNEYIHELSQPEVAAIYPDGIHGCIAQFLGRQEDISVRTAVLSQPENGLSEEVLSQTDVLIWWGHRAHDKVEDSTVSRVQAHVLGGMGLVALHSAHHSRVMRALLGTSLNLKWRHNDRERLWCVNPSHPIARGVPQQFELEKEEMYGEPFDIPEPDETVFLGWFAGGEVFRSAVTFRRGNGRIFYFQPGHEEYPVYHNENIRRIITNGVRWAYSGISPHCAIPVEMAQPLEWAD
ncbi:MAG: ThuA domain-containing protein [Oscillospiraceae bacterium]